MCSVDSKLQIRGRGAGSNASGRYEALEREAYDDGWGREPERLPFPTVVHQDQTKSAITRNFSPDLPFERSINPYRGCEHGCIYCYARPTHTYLGFSAGLDFETQIVVKKNAPDILAKELRNRSYRCRTIALGTNTDPYQPVEREYGITRRILEILHAHNHPVTIVTKSALVLRDLDILGSMAAENLVRVFVSIPTMDRVLASVMEPRAAAPHRRMESIAKLSEAGIPTGVMVAPLIPGLTEGELEAILKKASEAGAASAGYILLRLPLEVKDLFRDWLRMYFPEKVDRVFRLIRSVRNGRDNDPGFGSRMAGTGPYAKMLHNRFQLTVDRLGLNKNDWEPDETKFSNVSNNGAQLKLF